MHLGMSICLTNGPNTENIRYDEDKMIDEKFCISEAMGTEPVRLNRFDYTDDEDGGPSWQKWYRAFKYMLQAINVEDDDVKYRMLMHYMGDKAQEVYEGLPDPPENEKRGPLATTDKYIPHRTKYETAVDKLTEHFAPKQNKTYERHMFRLMKQEEGEGIATFAIRLDIQAARCDFGLEKDSQIKDQIIAECRSAAMRHEMLKRVEADLKEILKMAKVYEAVARQEKAFNNGRRKAVAPEEVAKVETNTATPYYRNTNRNRFGNQNRFANQGRSTGEKATGCREVPGQRQDMLQVWWP